MLIARHHPLPLVGLAIVAALVLMACAEREGPMQAGTSSAVPAAPPTGTRGAAHFDEGYVQIGSGKKIVDLFLDPICPFSKVFEAGSGASVFDAAAAGTATIRVRPMAFLHRLSRGTLYSTRAAAAFVAVAAEHPERARAFLHALFAAQPKAKSAGLSDDELARLAEGVGARLPAPDTLLYYRAWVGRVTLRAASGPLAITHEIDSISHVPTVVVNGAVFLGDNGRADAVRAFYDAH